MPTNVELATTIAKKLGDSAGIDDVMRSLLEAVGPLTEAVWYGVGSGGKELILLPGWTANADPALYVMTAVRGP